MTERLGRPRRRKPRHTRDGISPLRRVAGGERAILDARLLTAARMPKLCRENADCDARIRCGSAGRHRPEQCGPAHEGHRCERFVGRRQLWGSRCATRRRSMAPMSKSLRPRNDPRAIGDANRPFNQYGIDQTVGVSAQWIDEGFRDSAFRCGRFASPFVPIPKKLATIYRMSNELQRFADPGRVQSLQDDLLRACVRSGGPNLSLIRHPAPRPRGQLRLRMASWRASTGTGIARSAADLNSAMKQLADAGSTLLSASWALHPAFAAMRRPSWRQSGPVFPGIGRRGGRLLGLPAIIKCFGCAVRFATASIRCAGATAIACSSRTAAPVDASDTLRCRWSRRAVDCGDQRRQQFSVEHCRPAHPSRHGLGSDARRVRSSTTLAIAVTDATTSPPSSLSRSTSRPLGTAGAGDARDRRGQRRSDLHVRAGVEPLSEYPHVEASSSPIPFSIR